MKNKSIISMVMAVVTAVICLSSCGGIKKLEDLKVTSAEVSKISPNGLKGIKLDLTVGIDNPGAQVRLSEISCDVKHSGKVLGNVAVEPFTLFARTEETYNLKADVKVGDNMTVFDATMLLSQGALAEVTVDIHTKVTLKGGVSKQLNFTDIPLKELLETAKR